MIALITDSLKEKLHEQQPNLTEFFETEIKINDIVYEITFLPKKIVREESD
jgi:hypothetical protein